MENLGDEHKAFVQYYFGLQQQYDEARAQLLKIRAEMKTQGRNMEAVLMSVFERKLDYNNERYFVIQKKWKRAKSGEKNAVKVIKQCLIRTQQGLTERDAEHLAKFIAGQLYVKEQVGYQHVLRKNKKKEAPEAQAPNVLGPVNNDMNMNVNMEQQAAQFSFGGFH